MAGLAGQTHLHYGGILVAGGNNTQSAAGALDLADGTDVNSVLTHGGSVIVDADKANSKITVNQAGLYRVTASLGLLFSATAENVTISIYKNGAALSPAANMKFVSLTGQLNQQGHLEAFVQCEAGDYFTLNTTDPGSGNITAENVQFWVTQVG